MLIQPLTFIRHLFLTISFVCICVFINSAQANIVEFPEYWNATPGDTPHHKSIWQKIPIPGSIGDIPELQSSQFTTLMTEFHLGEEEMMWEKPTLFLGSIDRWVQVYLNGVRLLPSERGDQWQQLHPARSLILNAPRHCLQQGSNTLVIKIRRKFSGGIYRGKPAIGELEYIESRNVLFQRNYFTLQSIDFVFGILFILATLALWTFERKKRKLVTMLLITEIIITISGFLYYLPITDSLSNPQWALKFAEFFSLLFFSCGTYFFVWFYEKKPPSWLILSIVLLPCSGLTTFAAEYLPSLTALPPLLLRITALVSFPCIIFGVSVCIERIRQKDYWVLGWGLAILANFPLTALLWFGSSDSLDPERTFFWSVYYGEWSWRCVLLACGVAIGIVRTREAKDNALKAITASERERKRIARDLHDGVSQKLFAAKIQITNALFISPKESKPALTELKQNLDNIHFEMRQLCHKLHSQSLINGLAIALKEDALTINQTFDCRVIVKADSDELPKETKENLYKIYQEAVNNSIRHGDAKLIEVDLSISPKRVTLLIKDNGQGFDSSSHDTHGIGLKSMQERAESISATLSVFSKPKNGTTIKIVQVS